MKRAILLFILFLHFLATVYSLPRVLLLYNDDGVEGLIDSLQNTGKVGNITAVHVNDLQLYIDLSQFDAVLTAFASAFVDPTLDISSFGNNVTEAVIQGKLGFVNTIYGNTNLILSNVNSIRLLSPNGIELMLDDSVEVTDHPIFEDVNFIECFDFCPQAGNIVISGTVLARYNRTGNAAIVIENKVVELAIQPFGNNSNIAMLIANAIKYVYECNTSSVSLNCEAEVEITADESCTVTPADLNAVTFINGECASLSVQYSPNIIYKQAGPTTVSVTIDNLEPRQECFTTIYVQDNTPPTLTCPLGTVTPGDTHEEKCRIFIPDYTSQVTATDNCGVAGIGQSDNGFVDVDPNEVIVVNMTASDSSGLMAFCTIHVTATCGPDDVITDDDDDTRITGATGTTGGTATTGTTETIGTTEQVDSTTTGVTLVTTGDSTSIVTTEQVDIDDEDDDDGSLDAATTAAIAVSTTGGTFLLIAVIGAAFYVRRKKKRNRPATKDNLIQQQSSSLEMDNYSSSLIIKQFDLSKFKITDISIDGKIGSGNFGDVSKGVWMGTTPVALKKLRGDQLTQFMKEATIISKLNHPHIVQFLGIFEDKEEYFIVTEFIAGGSLLNAFHRDKKWNVDALLLLARDACAGLKYLHGNNVIHGDLSCRNLLIENDNIPDTFPINITSSPFNLKLCDFGMSKVLSSSQNEYTKDDRLIPVRWSSLESILYGKFSIASDIWSFGVVFWEILSLGKIPYAGLSNVEVIERVKNGYRLPQPDMCPEVLYKFMLRMWSENPQDRPNVQEVYDVIDKAYIANQQNQ